MFEIIQSSTFKIWLTNLRDRQARARIVARMKSARLGNLGDVRPAGEGISEMRIHYGPGYRIYFTKYNKNTLVLLIGGDKSSQKMDIKQAKVLSKKGINNE